MKVVKKIVGRVLMAECFSVLKKKLYSYLLLFLSDRCRESVERFLQDPELDARIDIGADMRKIHECFRLLKKKVLEKPSQGGSSNTDLSARQQEEPPTPREESPVNSSEMRKMKELLQQRDNEISILLTTRFKL